MPDKVENVNRQYIWGIWSTISFEESEYYFQSIIDGKVKKVAPNNKVNMKIDKDWLD